MIKGGDIIRGRYALVRLLGEGAAGSVWVALDQRRGIEVAIKLLRAGPGSRDTLLVLFEREAELSARMLSPHIVRVLDRGVTDHDRPFIVYELLHGEDLGKRMENAGGALPIATCTDIVVQVCRALGRAHSIRVVHCDIKPENIFLCDDAHARTIKVLDFGIATLAPRASLTVPSRPPSGHGANATDAGMWGTFAYMCPEHLLDSRPMSARGDLYALAVVAYRAITGRLPYGADSLGELLLALNDGGAPKPSSLRPALPPSVDDWFEKALLRDPDARFQTAGAMAETFRDAVAAR
jgi:serine/threonine-protein kinase